MSTFKRKSIDPKFVQEKFMAGEILARAHFSQLSIAKNKEKITADVTSFLQEVGGIVRTSDNDRQLGNRSASTSLLIPGLDLGLFHKIGFLHDIDQCTVRAYMYRDSATTVRTQGGKFYNIQDDKRNFAPVIDKTEFIEKYKKYYNEHRGDDTATDYNEVLANIFPESLLGMVLSTKDNYNLSESKFQLLIAKQMMKTEHQIELPMFLYEQGRLIEFNPSKEEILTIVDDIFNQNKSKLNLDEEGLKKVYLDMLSQLGYELSNPNLELDQIKAANLWKKESDIEAYEEFNTLSDSASKALLTELQRLDPKEKQESIKIIETTVKQIEILRKTKINSNAELQDSYSKLNDIIKSVSNEKAFQPTNIFKKAWNAIHVKIAKLLNTTPTLLFKTSTKKILDLYQIHLKDTISSDKPKPIKPKKSQ